MKHFILTLSLGTLTATCTQAQYFQTYYGSNDPVEFLTCGHNAYQGGPAQTGHFMVGAFPWASPGHFSLSLKVQRTDINGSTTSGAPFFNNEYFLTDIVNPPALPANLGVQNPQSLEFSPGGGGDFAVVGSYVNGGTAPGLGVFYLLLDPQGNILGTTGYYINTGNYQDIVVTAISESLQTPGDFYVCGYLVENTAAAQRRTFVLRLSKNGALGWSQVYRLNWSSNTDSDTPHDIIESPVQNPNSNAFEVIVVGEHFENSGAAWVFPDAFLLRIDDASGNMINPVQFYGTNTSRDVFTCIKPAANTNIDANGAGYIIGGYTDQPGNYDFWLMGLSQAWTIAWSNVFNYNTVTGPTTNMDFCNDLIERFNSVSAYEYYMVGYTNQGFFGADDVMVIKADANGNGVAGGQFTYGDLDADRGISIDQLNGFGANTDGLAIYAYSWPTMSGLGGFDHLLVKTYFNGATTCLDDQVDPDEQLGPGLIGTENSDNYNGNTFYDYPLLTVLQTPLSESNRCNSSSEPDGDNTRQGTVQKPAPGVKDAGVLAFPNPLQAAAGKFDLQLEAATVQAAEITVADMLGRVYYSRQATLTAGQNRFTVEMPGIRPGLYLVAVKTVSSQYKTLLQVK